MSVRHILLIGFMGSGKSTVGRILADRLAMPFVDVDALVESQQGETIARIFERDGEERFRKMETQTLEAVCSGQPAVVACGGGVVVRPANRALMAECATVVYLRVSVGEALARIGDVTSRPLLAGSGGTIAATRLLEAREGLYASAADLTVDTAGRSPRQVVEAIIGDLEDHRV